MSPAGTTIQDQFKQCRHPTPSPRRSRPSPPPGAQTVASVDGIDRLADSRLLFQLGARDLPLTDQENRVTSWPTAGRRYPHLKLCAAVVLVVACHPSKLGGGSIPDPAVSKALVTPAISRTSGPANAPEAPTLRLYAEARHFAMGAAVGMPAFRTDSEYRQNLAAEYNSLVPENAMKIGSIHPEATRYAFADADDLLTFAQSNHMAVHGHTLLWHQHLPAWITDVKFTKAQLLAVLRIHIETVVGRYKGRIATWDVVNEAVVDNGSLRNSIWLQVIGPEYIDSAFAWAGRADPAARLYLNDYGAEWVNAKSNAILSLVQGLRARGVPVHGVGFQAHLTPPSAASTVRENFARFASAGFDIRVSEMDVRIPDSAGASGLASQAKVYADLLDACLRVSRCIGFTTWGFTDESYQRKPAYDALMARLQQP